MKIKVTFTDGIESTYEEISQVEINERESYLDLYDDDSGDARHSFELADIKSVEIIVISE